MMRRAKRFFLAVVLIQAGVFTARACVQSETLAEIMKKPGTQQKASESGSIHNLIDGYHQFRQHYFTGDKLYKDLVTIGQKPNTLIISCSDSRVDPAILMNANPGDLFVVRNVANLVPPCESNDNSYHGTSAALEFGINGLGISNIIVLGHSKCAGIRSLFGRPSTVQAKGPRSFVEKWMEIAKPAYDLVQQTSPKDSIDKQAEDCAHYAVVNSLQNLRKFSWIAQKETAGKLTLHGWYFDLAQGIIHAYDQQTKTWKPL